MRPSGSVAVEPRRRDGRGHRALWFAATVGSLHALISLYWAFGGTWLIETLGARIVDAFQGMRWILVPVALVKLAAAVAPVELHHRGWPRASFWRPACWAAAGVLVAWGGINTVVGQLVLAGVIAPDGGYDRAAMIGHAWLWDPLFLVWGTALAIGLWLTGRDR